MDKQRYGFAMSSFSRMYGISITSKEDIKKFCIYWSSLEVNAPLSSLNEVDKYFYDEYELWKNECK